MAEPVTQFHLERRDSVALVTMDDGTREGRPNILGRGALESLAELLPELEESQLLGPRDHGQAWELLAAARTSTSSRASRRASRRSKAAAPGTTSSRASARFRIPTVAAINGGVLGGGVELALHCDYRVIADDGRHVASPECLLGFVPAWGATQLAPRLIGPEAAVKLIVANPMRQNKMLSAEQAHELGLVDRVIGPERPDRRGDRDRAEQPARDAPDLSSTSDVVARRAVQLDDSLHGAAPAPYRALDLIEGAQAWTLDEGYRAEEEALADLLFTPQAKASLYAFDVVERRARRGAGRPPPSRARARDRDRGRRADGLAARDALPAPRACRSSCATSSRRSSIARSRRSVTTSQTPPPGAGSTTSRRCRSPRRPAARRRTTGSRTATS